MSTDASTFKIPKLNNWTITELVELINKIRETDPEMQKKLMKILTYMAFPPVLAEIIKTILEYDAKTGKDIIEANKESTKEFNANVEKVVKAYIEEMKNAKTPEDKRYFSEKIKEILESQNKNENIDKVYYIAVLILQKVLGAVLLERLGVAMA